MQRKSTLFSGIAAKLSVLVGGAIAVTGAHAYSVSPATPVNDPNELPMLSNNALKTLPPKLILKQQRSGFRMIAQHDSHSSHSSHSSHDSHSSHSSHSSGGF